MDNLSQHPLLARFPNLANVQVIVDYTIIEREFDKSEQITYVGWVEARNPTS